MIHWSITEPPGFVARPAAGQHLKGETSIEVIREDLQLPSPTAQLFIHWWYDSGQSDKRQVPVTLRTTTRPPAAYERAAQLVAAGAPEKALERIATIAIDGGPAASAYFNAQVLLKAKFPAEALKQVEFAKHLDPAFEESGNFNKLAGLAYLGAGYPKASLSHFERYSEKTSLGKVYLAGTYAVLGNTSLASTLLQQVGPQFAVAKDQRAEIEHVFPRIALRKLGYYFKDVSGSQFSNLSAADVHGIIPFRPGAEDPLPEYAARARPQIEALKEWLLRHPDGSVLVEGHTDERGTHEYNLALGERRAKSVTNYLIGLGVPASRISVISYGEERSTSRDMELSSAVTFIAVRRPTVPSVP